MSLIPRIIFTGFNGVLIDSSPRYAAAFCQSCKHFGLTVPDPAKVADDVGNYGIREMIRRHITDFPWKLEKAFINRSNMLVNNILQNENNRQKELVNRPLVTLMQQNKAEGGINAIFSGTRESLIYPALKLHGIAQQLVPDYICGRDDLMDKSRLSAEIKLERISDILTMIASRLQAQGQCISVEDLSQNAIAFVEDEADQIACTSLFGEVYQVNVDYGAEKTGGHAFRVMDQCLREWNWQDLQYALMPSADPSQKKKPAKPDPGLTL